MFCSTMLYYAVPGSVLMVGGGAMVAAGACHTIGMVVPSPDPPYVRTDPVLVFVSTFRF